MRKLSLLAGLAALVAAGAARAEEPKQAPKIVLQSPDGKQS
jgi:hypothetical protein